ncbi:MAG: response regulator [Anaerolineales bacterium]|jgi:CheY-like chemotaxis protein
MLAFKQTHSSVLVVDDDTVFCEIMREILLAQGFKVHLAFSVEEAMKILEILPVDLILTDVMMPDIDGLSLIRHIRSRWWTEGIPTIVVSARVMPDEVEAARRAGADAFVPKPFSIQQLMGTIDAALAPGRSLAFGAA